ncbi:hypothetical protein JCM24511_10126 [Saitozyma sp. JCM 24511]|nr:hypothetical protein JCM24511_10126 [Saitozyma sp. JCM 24511]
MSNLAAVRRSTRDIGLAFEKHALRFCNHHLHMSLRRVGGAGDGGVDLRGWWWVPGDARSGSGSSAGDGSGARRIRVIGQCKAEKKGLGPKVVRELEGVMAHLRGEQRKRAGGLHLVPGKQAGMSALGHWIPTNGLFASLLQWSHAYATGMYSKGKERASDPTEEDPLDTIAVLLSQSGFSRNAMTHASRSSTPFLLVHLPGGQPYPLPSSTSADLESETETETDPRTEAGGPERGAEDDMLVEGAWWNAALAGPQGVLGGKMELKREILLGSGRHPTTGEPEVKARVGGWYDGKRFSRVGPPLEDELEL